MEFVIYLAKRNLTTLNYYKLSKLDTSIYSRNMPERQVWQSITPLQYAWTLEWRLLVH